MKEICNLLDVSIAGTEDDFVKQFTYRFDVTLSAMLLSELVTHRHDPELFEEEVSKLLGRELMDRIKYDLKNHPELVATA
jgi:hypothetical protein